MCPLQGDSSNKQNKINKEFNIIKLNKKAEF